MPMTLSAATDRTADHRFHPQVASGSCAGPLRRTAQPKRGRPAAPAPLGPADTTSARHPRPDPQETVMKKLLTTLSTSTAVIALVAVVGAGVKWY